MVTGERYSSCTTCFPPHTHSWQNSGRPSGTHNSNYYAYASYIAGDLSVPEPPFNDCGRDEDQFCDGSCGTCNNSYDPNNQDIHHKNVYTNIHWMEDNLASLLKVNNGDYNQIVLLTSSKTCYVENGNHSTGIYGVASYQGNYSVATTKYLPTGGILLWSWQWQPERVVQHEISHNIGATDNQCTSSQSQDCIMTYNSNMLKDDDFNNPNIWCSSCAASIKQYRWLHK